MTLSRSWCGLLATLAVLVGVVPTPAPGGTPGFARAADDPKLRLTAAGELKVADLGVHVGAVIDEDTVVLVGTTAPPEDPNIDPKTLAANGAIVDLAGKKARPFTNGHKTPIVGVAYARGRIATTSDERDPLLGLWDVKAGRGLAGVELEPLPRPFQTCRRYVAWFHKTDRMAIADEERVIVLDPARPGFRTHLPVPEAEGWAGELAVSPDDTRIACLTGKCGLVVWDVATKKATTVSLLPGKVEEEELWRWHASGCAFGPGGELYAWRNGPDEVPKKVAEADVPAWRRSVVRIDLPEGKVVPLGLGTSVATLDCAFDPTGTWMAVVGNGHTAPEVRVYRLKTRELVFREQMDAQDLGEVWVGFTPSGKRLVSANYNGRVKWWDVRAK